MRMCKQDDINKAMVVRETTNYEVKHENKKRKGGLGELMRDIFTIRRIMMHVQILIKQV